MSTARSLLDYVPATLKLFSAEDQDETGVEHRADVPDVAPPSSSTPIEGQPDWKLRLCYELLILPELEVGDSTLELNESLLVLWEKYTKNPGVGSIDYLTVKEFRKSLIEKPYKRGEKLLKRSAATVNRHMRHFYALISPLWPADRKNTGGKGLIPFFKKLKPLARQKALPFTFSRKDLSSLYIHAIACRPKVVFHDCNLYKPALWQCAMALATNAGPRSWDLFALNWDDFRPGDYKHGSIHFQAVKNKKVSRIPLNWVSRSHLDYIRSLNLDPVRIFPGFNKNKAFYRAWERICAAAGVDAPFEAMRKTCSTMHNNVIPDAGAWITAHSLRGVDAEYYDDPTERVLKAIYSLKLPREFKRGALALPTSRKTQSS